MNHPYFALWHERYDAQGQDHDKLLGVYSTEQKAEQALALLRNKPGFHDHPDGFDIRDGIMDETSMLEGFVTLCGDEEFDPNHTLAKGTRVFFPSADPMPESYWVLWLRYTDDQGYDHEIKVGDYTSRENAAKGIELVRDQPGFRDHPDGFVITKGTIDQTDMVNGFVTLRDNGREHDKPLPDTAPAR
jgi:homoserine kinase type II